jgi:hypothetical protein
MATVVAFQDAGDRMRIQALPIGLALPSSAETDAIEIPTAVKARRGLDSERRGWHRRRRTSSPGSATIFRFLLGRGPKNAACGFLPPGFFCVARDRLLAANRAKKAALATCDE